VEATSLICLLHTQNYPPLLLLDVEVHIDNANVLLTQTKLYHDETRRMLYLQLAASDLLPMYLPIHSAVQYLKKKLL
jgi:hypothetical protein